MAPRTDVGAELQQASDHFAVVIGDRLDQFGRTVAALVVYRNAGEPLRVIKRFEPDKNGKSKPVEYIIVDGHEERLGDHNRPPLSPKALAIQDITKGIAVAIGGDHTFDLARILRLPATLNRRDGRNGAEPKPSTLVSIEHSRAYVIDRFASFAAQSQDKSKRAAIAKIELKKPRKITVGKLDKLNDRLNACRVADVGARSQLDFALCCFAIENGIGKHELWAASSEVGKFKERGETYFNLTWVNAERVARERIYDKQVKRQERKAEIERRLSDQEERSARVEIECGPDVHRVVKEVTDALPNAAATRSGAGVCCRNLRPNILPDASLV